MSVLTLQRRVLPSLLRDMLRWSWYISSQRLSSSDGGEYRLAILVRGNELISDRPVCWIYVSEIPTNRLRGLNVSLAAATQWVFNLAVARATPVMLDTVGSNGYGTYFIYGSFCFVMAVGAWFLVPETKG